MIREALQYIVGLAKPLSIDHGALTFYTEKLERPPATHPAPIGLGTLSSLTSYIVENRDALALDKCVLIVDSPTKVNLVGAPDEYGRRPHYVAADAEVPDVTLNRFIEREMFQITLASLFAETPGRADLLAVVSTIEGGETRTQDDDGISQQTIAKTGVASKARVTVPPFFTLAPYSTFPEVKPVERSFLFRLRDSSNGGITCALFEADGNLWRVEARKRVAEWLFERLAGKVPVLA